MDDSLLDKIDIDTALARLEPAERELIQLVFKLEQPEGYDQMPWPPSLTDVGLWWGRRWHGHSYSESTIRHKRDAVLTKWRIEWQINTKESESLRTKPPRID